MGNLPSFKVIFEKRAKILVHKVAKSHGRLYDGGRSEKVLLIKFISPAQRRRNVEGDGAFERETWEEIFQ